MDVSTNALNAATVYLKGTTLTNGTQTINGMGNTAVVSAPTTSQFGICGWVSAGSSGTLAATYNSNTYCNTTTRDGWYRCNWWSRYHSGNIGLRNKCKQWNYRRPIPHRNCRYNYDIPFSFYC